MFLEFGQQVWQFVAAYILLTSIIGSMFVAAGIPPPDVLVIYNAADAFPYAFGIHPKKYIEAAGLDNPQVEINPVTAPRLVLAFTQFIIDAALKALIGLPILFTKLALLVPYAGPILSVGAAVLGMWLQLSFLRYIINLVFKI